MAEEPEKKKEVINSKIWQEVPEPDNPFAASACYCSGYDVYGDLLGKISWIEYLYLLFKLEPPTKEQAQLLEGLAVAIANPGPRDLSVRAAMNGGVAGSKAAACLIAGLAVGSGQYSGAREVYLAMNLWLECEQDISSWKDSLTEYKKPDTVEVWPDIDHVPGFDPYGENCPTPIIQTLDYLASCLGLGNLCWLRKHRESLEAAANGPLAITGIAAAVFCDLKLNAEQGEMLYLLLRLPGAAAHALEQNSYGWANYPFFGNGLTLSNDPGLDS